MKGIKIALIFFLVMFVGDLTSTLINGDLIQYLETNPLYHYLGLAGLSVLNLGVAAVFYYGYFYSKRPNTRHAFLYSLVLISILRIFIIQNNIQVYLNPPSLEVAKAIPAAVKQGVYWSKVIAPMFMAFVPAWLTFYLFERDHKITQKA